MFAFVDVLIKRIYKMHGATIKILAYNVTYIMLENLFNKFLKAHCPISVIKYLCALEFNL